MMGEGTVTGLFLCEQKGCPPHPVPMLHLVAGLGIEGDIHAGDGPRQVSLLAEETATWMEMQEQPGLCFKRFKANIRTEGLSLSSLEPGTRLSVGTAVLSVSGSMKACFPECRLFQENERCHLSGGCLFLKIEATGNIRKHDKIVIIA